MKNFNYAAVAFLASLLLTGCMFSQGLERTKTDKWERRDYPKLGISVEMPKDINVIRFRYGNVLDPYNYSCLSFFIHPEYYGYVEPHYVVSCFFDILNKKQHETFLSRNGEYLHFPNKDSTFFAEIKEMFRPNNRTLSLDKRYYRRDFRNEETGDLVMATAEYWKIIDPNHEEEDVATIRRILNSVQFIAKEEPKQNPDKTAKPEDEEKR